VQTSEKGKATLALIQSRGSSNGTLSAAVAAAADNSDAHDWADMYEDYLDAELEEDEEIESYYFSSAAGRARVVLGNRRWGEGGYMRAGWCGLSAHILAARSVIHASVVESCAVCAPSVRPWGACAPCACQRGGHLEKTPVHK
jgi:hypothetical protein